MEVKIKSMSDGSYTEKVYYVSYKGLCLLKAEDKKVCIDYCKKNNLTITE